METKSSNSHREKSQSPYGIRVVSSLQKGIVLNSLSELEVSPSVKQVPSVYDGDSPSHIHRGSSDETFPKFGTMLDSLRPKTPVKQIAQSYKEKTRCFTGV